MAGIGDDRRLSPLKDGPYNGVTARENARRTYAGADSAHRQEISLKRDLMDLIVCPMCREPFELTVDEENEREIVSGSLFCAKCNERYPIVDTIPNLLPPDLRRQTA